MRLVTMLLSVLARRVENGNGCLGLPKASDAAKISVEVWTT